MKYGNRPLSKRVMRSPFTLIGLFVLCAILIKATWSIHQKAVISDARLTQAESEYKKLQAHQQDLQSQISYLSTDQGIEAELRTKYRAVKNGESVAVIVGEDQTAQAEGSASLTTQVSWFGRLLHAIGL